MRWPATLWKHAGTELWRLVLLTASVLVCVISFALVVQLFAAGKVGPQDIPRLMILAMVPMLQYALPFATGFGATLAYHRMAQDNEIVAAGAGGLPHRTLLVPAMATGLALALALAALNEQVIPRFLRSIERMVTQDAVKLMVKSINSGEAVRSDTVMLQADRIFRLEPDPASLAQDRLIMEGVVALELDRDDHVRAEATAERARVWYFAEGAAGGGGGGEGAEQGQIVVRLENGVYDKEGESSARFDSIELRLAVPNAFKDDPKFLTFGELRRLRDEPERMNFVEQRRRDLAYHLGSRLMVESFVRDLSAGRPIEMLDPEGQRVGVVAGGLRWDGQQEAFVVVPPTPEAPIGVAWQRLDAQGKPAGVTTFQAQRALLRVDIGPDRTARTLRASLELSDYKVEGTRGARTPEALASGALETRILAELRPAPDPMPELLAMDSAALLELAGPRIEGPRGDAFVAHPARDLRERIERLGREITSKQHERWAMAASCLVMVLTGAVVAMRLGDSLPLTVYLWSFFPALGTLITISSGQQMVHELGMVGLVVLWGGVLGLGAYTFVAYRGLCRH